MSASIPRTALARLAGGFAVVTLGVLVAACTVAELSPEAKAGPPPAAAAPDMQPRSQELRPPRQDVASLRTSFADVVEPALDSIVSIEAASRPRATQQDRSSPFGMPFPFGMPEQEGSDDSFGSGVVVRADGVILTNNHVVSGADEVRVRFFDGREMKAKVLGTDPLTDLAVIKVEATGLTALKLGTSSDLRVGDLVFAVGNPFTLSQSVTMGIVSATGRSRLNITRGGYENFIQTDAPINPGNSGGALLDSRGEVIGINTAIFSSGARGNQGIGFAVPIDMVRPVMEQIVRDGKVVRSQLGVQIKQVDAALAKSYGFEKPMGALVVRVEKSSPAAAAGLQPADVIVGLDGRDVHDDSQLRLDISSRKPGSTVHLAVLRERDGLLARQDLRATLRELRLDEDEAGEAIEPLGDADNALRGLAVDELAELSPTQRRRLSISDLTDGVLVTEVEPLSPAARAGLRPGDVITSINREPAGSVNGFRELARRLGKDVVRLTIQRGDGTDIVALEP